MRVCYQLHVSFTYVASFWCVLKLSFKFILAVLQTWQCIVSYMEI